MMYRSLHRAPYCPLRGVLRSINRARRPPRRRRCDGAGGATAPGHDYQSTPTSLRSSPTAKRPLRHRPQLAAEHRSRGQSCDRGNRRRTFRRNRTARCGSANPRTESAEARVTSRPSRSIRVSAPAATAAARGGIPNRSSGTTTESSSPRTRDDQASCVHTETSTVASTCALRGLSSESEHRPHADAQTCTVVVRERSRSRWPRRSSAEVASLEIPIARQQIEK
jgi:hypothetical protein